MLVIGGLGFIGHHVVRGLEALGHEVTITDIQTDYGIVPLQEHKRIIEYRRNQINAQVYTIDVRDSASIDWLYRKLSPELVIHLAALPRQRIVQREPYLASGVIVGGMLNLLSAHSKHTPRSKLTYVSTSMVYGDTLGWIHEGMLALPSCNYAILKHTCESLLKSSGIPHTVIRPTAVYGEGDIEDRVISRFLGNAMRAEPLEVRGQDTLLSFTHVDDCAQGIIMATLDEGRTINNTYNIAYDGEPYTLLTAAKLAVACVGSGSVSLVDAEQGYPVSKRLSVDKAREHFNFSPTIDLKTGMFRYYDWLTSIGTK